MPGFACVRVRACFRAKGFADSFGVEFLDITEEAIDPATGVVRTEWCDPGLRLVETTDDGDDDDNDGDSRDDVITNESVVLAAALQLIDREQQLFRAPPMTSRLGSFRST